VGVRFSGFVLPCAREGVRFQPWVRVVTHRSSGAHRLEGFVSSVTETWSQRACEFDRHGQEAAAKVMRVLAAELTERCAQYLEELLTLQTAASESGFSREHLARLIRQGTLKNRGKKGAPRVSRGELPGRPTLARAATPLQLAPTSRYQVARSLIPKRG
jgi:AraC-like DNA-binding protein